MKLKMGMAVILLVTGWNTQGMSEPDLGEDIAIRSVNDVRINPEKSGIFDFIAQESQPVEITRRNSYWNQRMAIACSLCFGCGREFSSPHKLGEHEENMHKSFTCMGCGQSFLKLGLILHKCKGSRLSLRPKNH
jgi:hypothetical protein